MEDINNIKNSKELSEEKILEGVIQTQVFGNLRYILKARNAGNMININMSLGGKNKIDFSLYKEDVQQLKEIFDKVLDI